MLIKAFRLFVSSTFADFADERKLLQSQVFPALDAYCTAKGYQFYPVDLRWGVNEEAQLDQRTAEICLGEVRAATSYPPPNFLIMIGNRYGWVPLPYAIAQDEFETIVEWLLSHGRRNEARALEYAYQRDDNHLVLRSKTPKPRRVLPRLFKRSNRPDWKDRGGEEDLTSGYVLRSRDDNLPELKPAEVWAELEAQLRRALQEASEQLLTLGRIDVAARDKYFLSLTEQEITLGLSGPGADRSQAIAFIREIVGDPDHALARTAGYLENEPRLDTLKSRIRRALPDDCIVTAKMNWTEGGRLDAAYLAHFASAIQRKLGAAIDRHIARVEAMERAPDFALQSEREAHRAFAEQRRKVFVGRQSSLEVIRSYIAGRSDHPLVVHGRSGLGKSALLARASADAEAAGLAAVISRFVGASATSSDFRPLLESLVEDLAAHGIAGMPDQFEDDANKFTDQIRALLSSITKPVVIFLDALDQLRKTHRLGWVPPKLPPAVKLIVSVVDDAAYETDSGIFRSLRQSLPHEAFLEIEPLDATHGREILAALERVTPCRLQRGQRDYITAQFERAGGSPLYLRTSFEIARNWKSTDTAGVGRCVLAEDTPKVIAQLIGDLAAVHHHEPELVTRTLALLAAAKEGLSAKELTEVLSRDTAVMRAISSQRHGARADKLPPSVWVRLNRELAPFLVEKRIDDQPLLHFFHRQVAQVAREQHYEASKTALHAALATYFDSRAPTQDGKALHDKRSLSELPYQLHRAENTSRIGQILMSPEWMQQKLAAFGPRPLIDDYQYACTEVHKLIGRTLQLAAGILTRDERQLLPQLHGRLMTWTDASEQKFLCDVEQHLARPAILTQTPSLTPPGAEIARLEGHTAGVYALAALADGRLASGSADSTIRLWDPESGTETTRLEGHTAGVYALAVLADGRLASGSGDSTIRLWNSNTGAELARLERRAGSVTALAALPDGRLASNSDDRAIWLWDAKTGSEVARLEGHTDRVTALAVLPDGRLVSGSADKTMRLWDLRTGTETTRLEGADYSVEELAVLRDGRLAFCTGGKIIELWDATTQANTAAFKGHTSAVRALAALPDGRLASGSGHGVSNDNSIRLWDVITGTETHRFEGHIGWVKVLAVLRNGRLASGSLDNTIRLWDPNTAAAPFRHEGHTRVVKALAALPDGRLASGSKDETIRFWEAKAFVETASVKVTGDIFALAVLTDGRLASASWDGIRFWDLGTGTETARVEDKNKIFLALAVLPDGSLVSGSTDKTIQLWDVKTGSEIARLEGHTDWVNALAVLTDGRLASGSRDGTIRFWDLRTGTETARVEGHGMLGMVKALAVLPGGRLASGSGGINSKDCSILLWDSIASAKTTQLGGRTYSINALTTLPDGRLASGSADKTIRLWDVNAGREIAGLEVDTEVTCLAALTDGRLVAGDYLGRLHWLQIVA